MNTKTLSQSPYDAGNRFCATAVFRSRITLAVLVLMIAGCAAPPAARDPSPAPAATGVQRESADISVRLMGVLNTGNPSTLVKDPGWLEYILAVENISKRTLQVYNVKLLNREGRYLDSASSYDQIIAPPKTATEVAGKVATSAASSAAGQVIPYGGTIAGILSSTLSASAAESAARARQEMDLRKLKDVELAPAGKITGSAFLPRVPDAKALVLDYGHGEQMDRLEIPLR